jgi:hypothetical protein
MQEQDVRMTFMILPWIMREIVRQFGSAFSEDLKAESLVEGCTIFRKWGKVL